MEEKKKVTKRLEDLLKKEMVLKIRNYKEDISTIIPEVISWWGFDLFSRKPGPAYVDEDLIVQTTDLDLACFLYELADRSAVINIPTYKSFRPKSIKEGQIIVSSENRHGQIIGLVANKEIFTFSLKIKDMNVISTDAVGDFRNFTLTNFDGSWYDGWKTIDFLPDAKENKFIKENFLETNKNKISFKNFVHPNRWTSLFGQYYIISKILIDRLDDEAKNYFQQIKAMLDAGIKFPENGENAKEEWPSQTKEEGTSISVNAFEIKIEYPKIDKNEFPKYEYTQENLIKLSNLRKLYIHKIIPKLRFGTRATELSYYLRFIVTGEECYPNWIENKWVKDFVEPGKRTKWDRLEIAKYADDCGAPLAILRRIYKKSIIVDKEYAAKHEKK